MDRYDALWDAGDMQIFKLVGWPNHFSSLQAINDDITGTLRSGKSSQSPTLQALYEDAGLLCHHLSWNFSTIVEIKATAIFNEYY